MEKIEPELKALKAEQKGIEEEQKTLYKKYMDESKKEGGCGIPHIIFDSESADLRTKLDSEEFLITPKMASEQTIQIQQYDSQLSKKQKTTKDSYEKEYLLSKGEKEEKDGKEEKVVKSTDNSPSLFKP